MIAHENRNYDADFTTENQDYTNPELQLASSDENYIDSEYSNELENNDQDNLEQDFEQSDLEQDEDFEDDDNLEEEELEEDELEDEEDDITIEEPETFSDDGYKID